MGFVQKISIGQPIGIELVLGIDRHARSKGSPGEEHWGAEGPCSRKLERRIDEAERMAAGRGPRSFDAALRDRAAALKIGQIEAGTCATIRNVDLVSRLPYGAGLEFQRKSMIRWGSMRAERRTHETCESNRDRAALSEADRGPTTLPVW